MRRQIQQVLERIENENDVKVLFAVESGSRAWGFSSSESDYDVRFLYVHRTDWYLSIDAKRDVLEYPISDKLDVSGWDLKKALQLLMKSNPALLEWLRSPIVYKEEYSTAAQLRKISSSYLSEKANIFHYLHMAKGNYRDYLQGENVKIKKYFYVLRPLLACMWIEREHDIPPVRFEELLQMPDLSPRFLEEVNKLLNRKKKGEQLAIEAMRPALNQFIQEKITYYEAYANSLDGKWKADIDRLNKLFKMTLQEVWES
ncbi:MAG: nucleotidyltransferase domain-containing protein [Ectobacillus sp.]